MTVTAESFPNLLAELELLKLVDRRRALKPDDRGAGSRKKELERREAELVDYARPASPSSFGELCAAYNRIGLERAEKAKGRSRDVWEVLGQELAIAGGLERERAELAAV